MKVLIIEDDPNKLAYLRDHLRSSLPQAELLEERSYRGGLKAIVDARPDCILLDMTLPTYELHGSERGGRTRPFGGREILREMRRRNISSRVVIVTQFESFGEGGGRKTLTEMAAELEREFATNYVATVYYNPSHSQWRADLGALLHE